MANYSSYSSIISKTILDFDSIYDVLSQKSVKYGVGHSDLAANTTGVRTDEYASLIDSQLFRVAGVWSKSDVVAPSGIIANYSGQTVTITQGTATVTYSGNNAVLEIGIDNAGYYTPTSKVSKAIATTAVAISGALNKNSESPYSYTPGAEIGDLGTFIVAPANNSILREVSIAEGSLSLSISGANAATTAITNALTLDVAANTGIGSYVLTELASGSSASDYEVIQLTQNSVVSTTTTVTPTVAFTPGYISAIPEVTPTTYNPIGDTATETQTLYLPKGSVTANAATGGGISLTNVDSVSYTTSSDTTSAKPQNTYEIKIDGAAATITGNTTAGWVNTGSNQELATVAASTTRLFIAEGEVPDNSVTATLAVKGTPAIPTNSEDADAYEITIGRNVNEAASTTTAITAGYITDASYTTNVSVTDLTLSIAKAAVNVQTTLGTVTYTDADSIGTTTQPQTAGSYYTITPKISATSTVGSGTKSGYLDTAAAGAVTTTGLSNVDGNSFYILKAGVSVTHGLKTTTGSGSILTTSTPTGTEGTDYYKIESDCSVSVTPGYIASVNEVTETAATPYYIPKARFQYVQDSTAGSFIQVSQGGYVPSGVVSTIEGSLGAAAAVATLTGAVLSNTATTGAYQITISKNTTDTNAGYFSGTEGTLALDQDYYIAKGSLTASPVIQSISFSTVSKDTTGTDPVYKVTATATGSNAAATYSFTPGYITASELTMNAIANKVVDLELPEAVLTVTSGSATLTATASSNVDTVTTSPYVITPSLTGGSITAGVSSAGYVDTTVTSGSGNITVGNTEAVYIKAGSTSSISDLTAQAISATSDLTTTQAGDYTVTFSGTASVTGTLDSGYYPANSSITATRPVSGSATVAHGHANVSATGATVGFNTGNLTVVTTINPAETSKYYQVTASATDITLSKSGSTTGYIKNNADSDWTLSGTLTSGNSSMFYLKRYEWNRANESTAITTTTVDNAQLYDPTGQGIYDDYVIEAAGSYSDKDIYIRLSPNAAGTNVVTDLTRLQNRLDGNLVRS